VPLRSRQDFRVASITKSFVATVVLQLVGEGKLSLGDSMERWLPGLVPNGGAITVRELLNHTSGLFDYTDDPDFNQIQVSDPARVFSPRELMAIATSHEPLFAPGTDWSYSNTNYVVLGLAVEAVTGTTLEQQLRQRIIEPLGLTATSLPNGTGLPSDVVHGFIGSATLPIPAGALIDVTGALNASWFWGAGGIVSNADDVSRFYAALLGGRLLRPNLLAAMRATVPRANYGLGLMRVVTDCGVAFGHIGDFIAYRTVAYARPNGRRVAVVMVNIDTTHVQWATLEAAAETAFCKA
jgi:D-alanyl-D-alanine carboxypeptidase